MITEIDAAKVEGPPPPGKQNVTNGKKEYISRNVL
jgi:hypothetical protein